MSRTRFPHADAIAAMSNVRPAWLQSAQINGSVVFDDDPRREISGMTQTRRGIDCCRRLSLSGLLCGLLHLYLGALEPSWFIWQPCGASDVLCGEQELHLVVRSCVWTDLKSNVEVSVRHDAMWQIFYYCGYGQQSWTVNHRRDE